MMRDDIAKVLLSEEEIRDKVKELGRAISRDFEGKNFLMVSVLKGSVVFMSDLMRAIDIPTEIDFMVVSSYGAGTRSSGASGSAIAATTSKTEAGEGREATGETEELTTRASVVEHGSPFANIPFATAVRAPHRTSAVRLRTLSCVYRPNLLVHLLLRCSYQALRSNGMHLTGSLQ